MENRNRKAVYKEVPHTGQKYISIRCFFTEKYIDGKRNIKARLLARWFEEGNFDQNDSPICSKEYLTLMFTLLLACQSKRIKRAVKGTLAALWKLYHL